MSRVDTSAGAGGAECGLTTERISELVQKAKLHCPDYMSNRFDSESIEKMFGPLTMNEQKAICDALYVQNKNCTIKCLTTTGRWALYRKKPENDRGDAGSTKNRADSIDTCGIMLGLREGPEVLQDDDDPEVFFLLDWGTLLADGAKLAWERDKKKLNRFVQQSLHSPIKCKLLVKGTPSAILRFYVDYHNAANANVTANTIVQGWRSTAKTEARFTSNKDANKWTAESEGGQDALNERRLATARAMYPFRWTGVPFWVYSQAASFYKWSAQTKIRINIDGQPVPMANQISVWDDVMTLFDSEIDLSHGSTNHIRHPFLYENVNIIFKALRLQYPQWVKPVVALLFPRAESPWCKSSFCPDGLPNPPTASISQASLESLLRDMESSETVKLLLNPDGNQQLLQELLRQEKLKETEKKRKLRLAVNNQKKAVCKAASAAARALTKKGKIRRGFQIKSTFASIGHIGPDDLIQVIAETPGEDGEDSHGSFLDFLSRFRARLAGLVEVEGQAEASRVAQDGTLHIAGHDAYINDCTLLSLYGAIVGRIPRCLFEGKMQALAFCWQNSQSNRHSCNPKQSLS